MNQVDTALLEKQTEQDERFRYGRRDVRRRLPDGSYQHLQLPLTLYDVLHPQEYDKITNNTRHAKECRYLTEVISSRYHNDPSVQVLNDTGVYWDIPGLEHHSPDVAVIFGIAEPREHWPSFYVGREGVRPVLIIEVVSPQYRNADVQTKVQDYYLGEVPWYFIVDREHDEDAPTLLGYRWTAERYLPLERNQEGRMFLEPLGLFLGVIERRIALFDAKTGKELGDYAAISVALEAAEERAKLAEARASEAERLAAELQQRLRDLEEKLQHRNGPNGPPPKP